MKEADSPESAAIAVHWGQLNYLRHALVLAAWLASLRALRCGTRASQSGTSRAVSPGMEMLGAIVLLLFVAIGTLPAWPYSRRWTFYPTGACGGVVLCLVALILMGRF